MESLERLSEALTSIKWQWHFHTVDELPYKNLLSCLSEQLRHIQPNSWPERFKLGGVYLNGLRAEQDQELTAPCKVEYYEPKFEIDDIHQTFPKFDTKRIVFEDEWLIAYSKPHRLPTLPTKEQHLYNLKRYLEDYLGVMPHLPSRLDTSTEGLVIASKQQPAHKILQRAFENRKIQKYYLLEVDGSPEWEAFELDAAIGRDSSHPILRKVVNQGGTAAQTVFTNLKSIDTRSLLQASPLTGRTHQIRVHSAHLGYSIIGDNFYGGSNAPELRLMSYGVVLTHPITSKKLSINVPPELLPEWLLNYKETLLIK